MVWKRQPFRRMPDTECPTRGYGLRLGGEFAMAKTKSIVAPWAFAAGVVGAMLIAGASGGSHPVRGAATGGTGVPIGRYLAQSLIFRNWHRDGFITLRRAPLPVTIVRATNKTNLGGNPSPSWLLPPSDSVCQFSAGGAFLPHANK